jgi:predicted lipoprotein with Yx(FWY)xxD motif
MPTNKRLAIYLASGAAVSAIAVTAGILASSPSNAGPAKPTASASVITTRSTGSGQILVDGRGRTLYLFAQDTGTTPTCTNGCTSYWPPVPASATARTAGGATAADLASTTAPGGGKQLTYAGHPLYYFAGDQKSGDTNGQNLDQFGAKWYVLNPAGAAVTTPITKSAKSAPSGGSGYGY